MIGILVLVVLYLARGNNDGPRKEDPPLEGSGIVVGNDYVYENSDFEDWVTPYELETELPPPPLCLNFDPTVSERVVDEWVHVVYPINGTELNDFFASVRSWLFFRHFPLHLHLIAEEHLLPLLRSGMVSWKMNPKTFRWAVYPLSRCRELVQPLNEITNTSSWPEASLCKVALHELLPPNVTFALAMDPNTWVTGRGVLNPCWKRVFDRMEPTDAYIGLVRHPMPHQPVLVDTHEAWPAVDQVDLDTSLVWLDLDRMRSNDFLPRLKKEVQNHFSKHRALASKGERDFLNLLRFQEPKFVFEVDCNCNFPLVGTTLERRNLRCPDSTPIFIVQGPVLAPKETSNQTNQTTTGVDSAEASSSTSVSPSVSVTPAPEPVVVRSDTQHFPGDVAYHGLRQYFLSLRFNRRALRRLNPYNCFPIRDIDRC